MRVEIKIDQAAVEPYAVLHAQRLTAEISTAIEMLEGMGGTSDLLAARRDGKAYIIEADQVELVRTEGGSVVLYDRTARAYTVDKALREVEKKLGNDFVRISKSAVVNVHRIDHVAPSFNGTMDIILKNGMNDYISRKYLSDFKKRLGL